MATNDDFDDFELIENPSSSEVVNYLSIADYWPRKSSSTLDFFLSLFTTTLSQLVSTSNPLVTKPKVVDHDSDQDEAETTRSASEPQDKIKNINPRRRSFDGIEKLLSINSPNIDSINTIDIVDTIDDDIKSPNVRDLSLFEPRSLSPPIGQQMQVQRQLSIQQQSMLDDLEFLKERYHKIRHLETTVVDLNELFKDMATRIEQQREPMSRIESDLQSIKINIEKGHLNLAKAERM